MKYIFKAFNYFVGFVWAASLCAVDSVSNLPTILLLISSGYLMVLALRYGKPYVQEEEE